MKPPKHLKIRFFIFIVSILFLSLSKGFAEDQSYVITIKDHEFSPKELKVPAHQKIKIVVDNQDSTVEEFESYDLNREKLVMGHGKITVFIGPLKPGTYKYFGEFHQATAQGVIIAE